MDLVQNKMTKSYFYAKQNHEAPLVESAYLPRQEERKQGIHLNNSKNAPFFYFEEKKDKGLGSPTREREFEKRGVVLID